MCVITARSRHSRMHRFLPPSALKPTCRSVVSRVSACLFVTQPVATFGVKRKHTDALATATRSWKGAVRECTPHTVCSRRCYTAGTRLQKTIDQVGRVLSTSIYRNPFLPEPSSNILPETSKNLENLLDDSRLF